MTTITLHEFDDGVADALRERAAEHGCSIEQEASAILRDAVNGGTEATQDDLPENLATAIQELFKPFGIKELPIPPRQPPRPPPTFD